jgi:hypothetical protein
MFNYVPLVLYWFAMYFEIYHFILEGPGAPVSPICIIGRSRHTNEFDALSRILISDVMIWT